MSLLLQWFTVRVVVAAVGLFLWMWVTPEAWGPASWRDYLFVVVWLAGLSTIMKWFQERRKVRAR